jgi:glucokinase
MTTSGLASERSAVIGIDIGGTTIKGARARYREPDTIEERLRRPTRSDAGPAAVVAEILAVIDDLIAGSDVPVCAIGVAAPGLVDEARGVALWSENIGWQDLPLRSLVERHTGRPTWLGHDVRAGGVAEFGSGAAQGANDAVFLPLGTGIGAALLTGGRIHDAQGLAGEIGHADVGHGETCRCGAQGCLEAIASAGALVRRYAARTGHVPAGAEEVAARVCAGDPDARAVWDDALDALTLALSWVASVLAPEVVVVGGGLSLAGDLLFGPLATMLEARLTFQRRPRLVAGAYGDEAASVGAAILARKAARAASETEPWP